MKTNKEYPATHSMMTSWFAIDDDGCVAIMNYEDNGPVPAGTPESNEEDLIMADLASPVEGKPYKTLHLTKEEVKYIMDNSIDYPSDFDREGYYNAIVKVESKDMNLFLEAVQYFGEFESDGTICLDEDEGLFYINWYGYDDKTIKMISKTFKAGIIKPLKRIFTYNDNTDLSQFPFYVYDQEYNSEVPMKRRQVPFFKFNADRLPKEIRCKAHRLPVRFAEMEKLQIAEFLPFASYWLEEEPIDGRPYYQMKDSNNNDVKVALEAIYYAGCGKTCRKCFAPGQELDYNPSYQNTRHPTVMVVTNIHGIKHDFQMLSELPFSKAVFLPIVEGLAYTETNMYYEDRRKMNYPIDKMFANCRFNLEKNIEFFKPRVILLFEDILQHITSHYKIDNGIIHIAGDDYPVYIWEQREQHMEELIQLASMDYRGREIEWKIPVEVKP